jgi:tRNA (guanine-N7-)-methyltransferase
MEKAIIRTFGRIHGKKLSARQQWLIDNLLPLLKPAPRDFVATPSARAGVILEIGFGAGEHLAELAEQNPDSLIIGAEPFINGVASLLSKITDEKNTILPQYKNIRIWPDDARKLLAMQNIDCKAIYILHPDPWPKARHEKRRLLSAEFLKTLSSFISKDARIIIGTDHTDYYNWIIGQAKQTELQIMNMNHETIKTRYQKKNMFGSSKTMYLSLGKK